MIFCQSCVLDFGRDIVTTDDYTIFSYLEATKVTLSNSGMGSSLRLVIYRIMNKNTSEMPVMAIDREGMTRKPSSIPLLMAMGFISE